MRFFHYTKNKFHCPILNLDKLWSLVPDQIRDTKTTDDKVPVIDVVQHVSGGT